MTNNICQLCPVLVSDVIEKRRLLMLFLPFLAWMWLMLLQLSSKPQVLLIKKKYIFLKKLRAICEHTVIITIIRVFIQFFFFSYKKRIVFFSFLGNRQTDSTGPDPGVARVPPQNAMRSYFYACVCMRVRSCREFKSLARLALERRRKLWPQNR